MVGGDGKLNVEGDVMVDVDVDDVVDVVGSAELDRIVFNYKNDASRGAGGWWVWLWG